MLGFKEITVLILTLSPLLLGSKILSHLSFQLQSRCEAEFSTPISGELTQALGSALICGKSMDPGPLRSLFIDLGLYHILVVSGSHLVLIATILMFLLPPGILGPILILYSFMTGLEPPVLRALFEWGIKRPNRPAWISQLGALGMCLVFDPTWTQSRSLFLSAIARQCISEPSSVWKKAALVQICLWPLLFDFQSPTFLSITASVVFGFLIEIILFPLLFLVFLWPPLSLAVEPGLELMVRIFQEILNLWAGGKISGPGISPGFFLIYWMAIFLILEFRRQKRRRAWYFR